MKYVIGDIHCQVDALTRLLGKLNLQEEDEVYFVGDWVDRCFRLGDYIDTMQWVVDHIRPDSKFKSVIGNHDKDVLDLIQEYINEYGANEGIHRYVKEYFYSFAYSFETDIEELCRLFLDFYDVLKSMPLYYRFSLKDKDYIVTHSWLIDRYRVDVFHKEFNWNCPDDYTSMWDRNYSTYSEERAGEHPIIIHGHTPTLGKNDIAKTGIRPLARIMHVTGSNINVDCCAFRSPMLGGNLAAYRCDDGAEFYAYEDSDFYTLVNMWAETPEAKLKSFSREEYIFAVLCHHKEAAALLDYEEEALTFDSEESKRVYRTMKSGLVDKLSVDSSAKRNNELYALHEHFKTTHTDVVDCFTEVWKTMRERFYADAYHYNKSIVSIAERSLNDFVAWCFRDTDNDEEQ